MVGIIVNILIGFVIGLLARFFKPGNDKMGFILTSVVGILGSSLATILGQAVGLYHPGDAAGFIGSVIGAVILLSLLSYIRKGRP
ncbi:MAG: GlsB/YeaQ/YmgE family stress response membrane protein [Bdellovibrionaceae bacterium]|nr:GlsB/YeaQ/YmgE family stress response membrane protein [Pseudobdellovibrionaceae bacterium]